MAGATFLLKVELGLPATAASAAAGTPVVGVRLFDWRVDNLARLALLEEAGVEGVEAAVDAEADNKEATPARSL